MDAQLATSPNEAAAAGSLGSGLLAPSTTLAFPSPDWLTAERSAERYRTRLAVGASVNMLVQGDAVEMPAVGGSDSARFRLGCCDRASQPSVST